MFLRRPISTHFFRHPWRRIDLISGIPPVRKFSTVTDTFSKIPDGFLSGILAVGYTHYVAGPEALARLVTSGAVGIKVEEAKQGDPMRHNGSKTVYNTYNRGVYSISSKHTGLETLLSNAHVIIDNRSPSTRKKDMTLATALRNRKYPAVVCAISGFGPDSDELAYDRIIQVLSGMANLNADKNDIARFVNFPLIDISTGTEAALQISNALHWLKSISGQERQRLSYISLEISMFAVAIKLLANSYATYLDTKEKRSTIVPFGLYPTKTCQIAVATANDEQFLRLCKLLNLSKSSGFITNKSRRENRGLIEEELSAVLATKRAKEWEDILKPEKIPVGSVLSFEESVENNYHNVIKVDSEGHRYISSPTVSSNCFPCPAILRGAPQLNQDEKLITELVSELKKPEASFPSLLFRAKRNADPNSRSGFYARVVNVAEIDFKASECTLDWTEKEIFYAKKVSQVYAKPAVEGEKLITQIDGYKITDNIAKKGDWKVTTLQGDSYFISGSIFKQRYFPDKNADGAFLPKIEVMKMIKIIQDIRLIGPWGSPQFLPADSVIAHRSAYDTYGIHKASFEKNYERCDVYGGSCTQRKVENVSPR